MSGTHLIIDLLQQLIRIESISGNERRLTEFVAVFARRRGWTVDLWQADELAIHREAKSFGLNFARHLPLDNRPTLVVKLAGNPDHRSVIFNAHADVVAAPNSEKWIAPPFAGEIIDGRVIGRGACDVKGPLAAAIGAMIAIEESISPENRGDILLEIIPGEEDCVGLGTFTSVARGHRADAAIILEPTENLPCSASRGGVRFEIFVAGRSVHGTVKWLGDDAIQKLRAVLNRLPAIEAEFNDRDADELFLPYPIARPITVDSLRAGEWQGMIADRATCAGYLELLPGDSIDEWQKRFHAALAATSPDLKLEVNFTEAYDGHRTDTADILVKMASTVCDNSPPRAFNSGCEAGLRARVHGTPTLVWGPGSLSHAHAIDESIAIDEIELAVARFTEFLIRWCGSSQMKA